MGLRGLKAKERGLSTSVGLWATLALQSQCSGVPQRRASMAWGPDQSQHLHLFVSISLAVAATALKLVGHPVATGVQPFGKVRHRAFLWPQSLG